MKRQADNDDNVYFRVNKDLSRVLHEFTHPATTALRDIDGASGERDISIDTDTDIECNEPMPLGFKAGETYSVIDGIKKRPLPREDGYEDDPTEALLADERPYGKAYFDEQLERERIMQASEDYRFVVLLSGAMGKSPIDLYQEEDLERLLRQREADRLRMQQELRRTIVPVQEKRRQRELLLQQKQRVINDQERFNDDRYDQLIALGSWLIDGALLTDVQQGERYGLATLSMLQLDLEQLMYGAPEDDARTDSGATQEERDAREKEVSEAHEGSKNVKGDKNAATQQFTTPHAQYHASFVALTLFRAFFDNQETWHNAAIILEANTQLYRQASSPGLIGAVLDDMAINEYEDALALLPIIADRASEEPGPVDRVGAIQWRQLRGTETVVMSLVEQFYDEARVNTMVEQGLSWTYGDYQIEKSGNTRLPYADIIWEYLSTADDQSDAAQDVLRLINIMTDHPPALANIIRLALPQGYGDGLVMRRIIRSHLIWHYFDERSALGLALDWYQNTEEKKRALYTGDLIRDTYTRCGEALTRIKAILLFYFTVLLKAANRDKIPVMLGSTSLFKFPATMTTRYVYDTTRSDTDNARDFDSLNALFTGATNPVQFIRNSQFRRYYLDGVAVFLDNYSKKSAKQTVRAAPSEPEAPMAADSATLPFYVQAHYPVVRLHDLLVRYNRFVELYRTFLGRKLDETEAGLQAVDRINVEIARENTSAASSTVPKHPHYEQRLSYTGLPINSGIIRLKSVVVLFMNKAFNLIRQYCTNLSDIGQEDLQSQSAFDCGLTADYASYVAALIAENQIIFAVSYKSLSSQRNTLANTTNAMARLKRYDKREVGRGGRGAKLYEFFVAEEHARPTLKKRRLGTGSIYVTM